MTEKKSSSQPAQAKTSKKDNKGALVGVFIMIGVLVLVMVVAMLKTSRTKALYTEQGVQAKARVINKGYQKKQGSSTKSNMWIEIEYQVDSKKVTAKINNMLSDEVFDKTSLGSEVDVLYLAENPESKVVLAESVK